VRVAQALGADAVAQRLRQARREGRAAQVEVGVEKRERATLLGQLDRRVVGGVAQQLGDTARRGARRRAVVAQPEHH
jgi:hypothetical protein